MEYQMKLDLRTNLSVAIAAVLFTNLAQVAQAQNISTLDTGAGLYNVNNGGAVVDPNWSVSLLSTVPSGQIPPGGIPDGSAYLVPNNIGFPFGYWLPNDATSSWITYSTPTQVGGDLTADTFQYQVSFTAANSGTVDISWLSDNDGSLYVNGSLLGTDPNPLVPNPNNYTPFDEWAAPVALNVTADTEYTVDLDVYNIPQDSGNPTGARVEFTGDVNVENPDVPGVSSVPEESSMLVNSVLLALPVFGGAIRRFRKNNAA
jgi:hypothetical protein